VPGRAVAIQGTLDKRDDTVRATAQKLKVLAADPPNGAQTNGTARQSNGNGDGPLVLRFSTTATPSELQEVRQILGTAPGNTAVRLMFERANGELLRLDVGAELCVDHTAELKQKLARWLAA
jgi:hypothetical protein